MAWLFKKKNNFCHKVFVLFFAFTYTFTFSYASLMAEGANRVASINMKKIGKKEKLPFVTKFHVVKKKESLLSLSKRYNISVAGIKRLNPKKRFKTYRAVLKRNTKLILPKEPLSKEVAAFFEKQNVHLGLAENVAKKKDGSNSAKEALSNIANLATFEKSPLKEAEKIAIQGATSQVNGKISDWLNQYGTAKINLALKNRFALDNSSLEVLLPLCDKSELLIFTQGSFAHKDSQMTMNIGFGSRYFINKSMIGLNSFFDYNLSQQHARMGAGFEYWRDYLKLGMNGYFAITNWKESALTEYNTRPANGFDIAAKAYLPMHPQLGFDASFEKYFGEVALFDKEKRTLDASAYDIGINYTPIPLITLAVDHKRGGKSESSTRFGLDLVYRFGVPFKTQIDKDAVDSLRSLAGSRYDFVNRNKEIILAYEKKAPLVVFKKSIEGKQQKKVEIIDQVNKRSDWEIETWDIPKAFTELNGKLEANCQKLDTLNQCQIVLPNYNLEDEKANSYALKLTLKHKKTDETKYFLAQASVLPPEDIFYVKVKDPIEGVPKERLSVFDAVRLTSNWELKGWTNTEKFEENDGQLLSKCTDLKTLKACQIVAPSYKEEERKQAQENTYNLRLNFHNPLNGEDKAINVTVKTLKVKFGKFSDFNTSYKIIGTSDDQYIADRTKITLDTTINNHPPVTGLEKKIIFNVKDFAGKDIENLSVKETDLGIYTADFIAKGKDIGTYKIYVKYENILIEGLSDLKIKIDPNFAPPSPGRTTFKTTKDRLLLKQFKGLRATISIDPHDAIGNEQNNISKHIEIIAKDYDTDEIVPGVLECSLQEKSLNMSKSTDNVLNYNIYALKKGHYTLSYRYKRDNIVRYLGEIEVFFIDGTPSDSSLFYILARDHSMISYQEVATDKDGSYLSGGNLRVTIFDEYGKVIDYSKLSTDPSLFKDTLTFAYEKSPSVMSKQIAFTYLPSINEYYYFIEGSDIYEEVRASKSTHNIKLYYKGKEVPLKKTPTLTVSTELTTPKFITFKVERFPLEGKEYKLRLTIKPKTKFGDPYYDEHNRFKIEFFNRRISHCEDEFHRIPGKDIVFEFAGNSTENYSYKIYFKQFDNDKLKLIQKRTLFY